MNKKILIVSFLLLSLFLISCDNVQMEKIENITELVQEKENTVNNKLNNSIIEKDIINIDNIRNKKINEILEKKSKNEYQVISVDGGDQSGKRKPNVIVDFVFGDKRLYLAFTNKYGQLEGVIADKIILQNDDIEAVTSKGRYYWDEAKVPGTEHSGLDEGHVIADSLGGVSNAYNITPQNSTLNRHGEQAYMEKTIRQAGSCENFIAIITYPDTKTQIPDHYYFIYEINGETVEVDFENINPEEANEELGLYDEEDNINRNDKKIEDIDVNNNGTVTISEAKAAGFKMPIDSNHWLYEYMYDGDNDGFVGE